MTAVGRAPASDAEHAVEAARLCIGLMSGTSVDAVDGALLAFSPDCRPVATLAFRSRALPETLRDALHALQSPGHDELARAAQAGNALSDLYGDVVSDLLAASGRTAREIDAIGAHGQTVRHRPELGYTIQLLNPARLAERTGIAVVADLRSADVAAGGQGAPLAPAFHAMVFSHPRVRRVIVNLGGIANVTLLPATGRACAAARVATSTQGAGGGDRSSVGGRAREDADAGAASPVLGFDTGPAYRVVDVWCRRHTGQPFDDDGRWAAGGRILPDLLARLSAEPYFRAPAPKSTGRDLFGGQWLDAHLQAWTADKSPDTRDVQATLAQLTADSVADACLALAPDEVWICGGGTRNTDLVRRLAEKLAPLPSDDTGGLGVDPQAVEAAAFAWLACRRLSGQAGNLPAVTGARGPRTLGAVWPAPPG